jgi:hypothetical protein
MCFPSMSTSGENQHSMAHDDNTHATYGYSWMLCAIKESSAANCSKAGAHDELETYLDKLENVVDIIGWWGVSVPS